MLYLWLTYCNTYVFWVYRLMYLVYLELIYLDHRGFCIMIWAVVLNLVMTHVDVLRVLCVHLYCFIIIGITVQGLNFWVI